MTHSWKNEALEAPIGGCCTTRAWHDKPPTPTSPHEPWALIIIFIPQTADCRQQATQDSEGTGLIWLFVTCWQLEARVQIIRSTADMQL